MISIIVIAYNEEDYIKRILRDLTNQTEKNFEVIVVDSNSNDRTEEVSKEILSGFKEFTYIKLEKALGPAFARNKGAEVAKYERLIFFDADTSISDDFIYRIEEEINSKHLSIATCPIRILEGGIIAGFGAFFLNTFMVLLKPFYSSGYGACLITTREVHALVGGFNEKVELCEDCNYIKKARKKFHVKYGILSIHFYTSERRAKSEGRVKFILTFIKIHLYRMFTGKEIFRDRIVYTYGDFEG